MSAQDCKEVLKMEMVYFSETLVFIYECTRRQKPERHHHHDDVKSYSYELTYFTTINSF